jgi:hypothetical protein
MSWSQAITGVIFIVLFWYAFNFFFPPVKTVCLTAPMVGKQFDCNLIYNHLSEHQVSGAVEGSLTNIDSTACSQQVREAVGKATNTTLQAEGCQYHCCITDGTTSGVNQQAYSYQ